MDFFLFTLQTVALLFIAIERVDVPPVTVDRIQDVDDALLDTPPHKAIASAGAGSVMGVI